MNRPDPYPSTVIEILNGVAIVCLLVGTAGTAVVMRWAFTGPHEELALRGSIGIGVFLASLAAWAVVKALALIVSYLWTVQAELQRREPRELESV